MNEVDLNDLELILKGAKIIQNGEKYHTVIERLKEEGRENLPIEAVYEIAENEGIYRENIDNYIKIRFPSEEMQKQKMEEIKSVPSINALLNFYKKKLITELETKLPNEIFEWKAAENRWHYYYLSKKIKDKKIITKRRFFKKYEEETIIEREEKLIDLWTWGENYSAFCLEINQPFVAEICKDKLKELEKRFSHLFEEYNITANYLNY